MTAPIASPIETSRRLRLLLVVTGHLLLALILFSHTVIGLGFYPVVHPVIGAMASVGLCGAQLVLALARPSARWSMALLIAIVLLSVGLLPVLDLGWLGSFWFAGAAAFLVLPRRWAATVASTLLLVWLVIWARDGADQQVGLATNVVGLSFVLIIGPFGAAALYSLARLPALVQRLQEARAAAAEQAADRERSRVSRDLHDLVGQSLSAITLKSGLAERLLPLDRSAAARQLEDLEQIAAELAREASAVAAGQRRPEFTDEATRAQALLRAAGVATTLDLCARPTTRAADALFGWAVREATTNVLRHSRATSCTITTAGGHEEIWLEIVNDRAVAEEQCPNGGSGLLGLADRARALGGRVDARPVHGDRFRVRVELPGEGR
ncbi:MAG: histidine kinase [Actinomycetota bacterium]